MPKPLAAASRYTLATELLAPSLRALSRLGPDIERRAQESGLSILTAHGLEIDRFSDLAARISHAAALALLENAVRVSGDPAFALRAGGAMERGDLGLFHLLSESAPTLRDSMSLAARYISLVHDAAVIEVVEHDEHVLWKHRLLPGAEGSAASNEYVVSAFYFAASRMLGFTAPPADIWMMHDAPAHADAYLDVFGVPARFGCEHNAIVLPRLALDLPLVTADAVLLRVLEPQAVAQLKRGPHVPLFAQRVQDIVRTRLADAVTIAEVAELLHMSPSSVQRRLSALGASYTQLVDDVRRERALDLLQDHERSVSEIAFQLGFAHPPAFHRAFRRWFSRSPSEHRTRIARSDFYFFYGAAHGSGRASGTR